MKTASRILIGLLILLTFGFILWFGLFLKPETTPGPADEKALLDTAASKDVIIVFNSGGWGNTSREEAADFAPILAGIQETLAQSGFSSVVTPFVRTSSGLLAKMADFKDIIYSFKYSSEVLAGEVESVIDNYPDKQVIIAGLSNGGGLTQGAMKMLADKPGVYGIVVGVPWWYGSFNSDSILRLDNNGKDTLAAGDYKLLALAVIEAPFKWILAKIQGQKLSFAWLSSIPGTIILALQRGRSQDC